uniref:Uncharacterized protein n=1 Tax=Globodera rostochiensis TaxID=31243 RepID=A0A914GX98_GLORO
MDIKTKVKGLAAQWTAAGDANGANFLSPHRFLSPLSSPSIQIWPQPIVGQVIRSFAARDFPRVVWAHTIGQVLRASTKLELGTELRRSRVDMAVAAECARQRRMNEVDKSVQCFFPNLVPSVTPQFLTFLPNSSYSFPSILHSSEQFLPMVHGPQCICEICTCGRHQCPFGGASHHQQQRQQAVIANTEGTGEGHFYRKEFATLGSSADRAAPARPKDEISLPQGPFTQREAALSPSVPPNARSTTFVTSAALRRRAHQSQIDLGGTTAAETTGGMRSTYREESERALQGNGAAAARGSRRPNRATENGGREALFGTGVLPTSPTSTIHQTEFGQKVAARTQNVRPKTSDLWKRDGQFDGKTVSQTEFAAKKQAERAEPFRPRENGPLVNGSGEFQRETSNLRDYGPKRGERAEARRPIDSDMFKSEEPLEGRSVNRGEYGLEGRGERFEAKPHESSEIWKSDGTPFDGRGVNAAEYGRTGRGDRYAPTKPTESDILKGHGPFARETNQRAEFGPKRAERAEVKKRTESDIWKKEGRAEMDTVNRTVFKGIGGERAEAKRPTESHILRGEGKLAAESVARTEFGHKGQGDRFPAKKPGTAELWRREGAIGAEGTVNRKDYAIEGKKGERHEIHWGRGREATAPLFHHDNDSNVPVHVTSVHRTEFVPRERTERPEQKVPVEEGADLWRGDGTFVSETSKSIDYQPKKGERFDAKPHEASEVWKSEGAMEGKSVNNEAYSIEGKRGDRHEAKRHGESDLWKREGPIARSSVNRDDYSHVLAERAQPTRPTESDILKGHGPFARETNQRAEFGPKRAERAETKKPIDSDLFTREGAVGEMGTVNRTDFVHQQRGDRYERRVPPESRILVPDDGARTETSTVSRAEFGEKRAEPSQRHRPTAQFRLDQGQQADYTTVSREDFVAKKAADVGENWSSTERSRHANSESNLLQNNGLDREQWAREYGGHTHSREQFGPKEVSERAVPVVPHGSQLSISTPGAMFDSNTMYSDHFQVSPESFTHIERPQQIRPSTALRLHGDLDMSTGYRADFQNKVRPCPAGELVQSLKKDDVHTDTEHFQFHAVNKGHRLYKSKENLAMLSAGGDD